MHGAKQKLDDKMKVDPDLDMDVKRLRYINEREALDLTDNSPLERLEQARKQAEATNKPKSKGDDN